METQKQNVKKMKFRLSVPGVEVDDVCEDLERVFPGVYSDYFGRSADDPFEVVVSFFCDFNEAKNLLFRVLSYYANIKIFSSDGKLLDKELSLARKEKREEKIAN